MYIKFFAAVLFLAGLTACSTLFSTGASESEGTREGIADYVRQKRNARWDQAREELGMSQSRELTGSEAQAIKSRVELTRMENQIPNSIEKKQYYSYKPYFRSDAERIFFLRLPSRDVRERWAAQKGISTTDAKLDTFTSNLIEKNDVAQGMTRFAVQQSWGEPDLVEVAGNPMYGNERWRYNKLVPTDDGYKQEIRIVYFESGRVIGWETL